MKEMTVDDWGELIFNKIFKVIYINYETATTTVLDTLTDTTYNVTYNIKTGKMELEELDNE